MGERELYSVAFPTLSQSQIDSLARCTGALLQRYHAGQTLFEVGDRNFKFFVIKSGEIEIVDPSGEPPKTVMVHGPGEFTGEVAQLTGGPSIVTALARSDCEVYEVPPDALRQVLAECPDLGDLILQAFIARRHLLRESGSFVGVRVIGSRYSQDTFRVRDFLARNRILFTWFDLESDPQVNQLLKQFGFTEADTPVVALGVRLLLRNPSNKQLAEALGICRPPERIVYDLAIVGAGPAGLAAAVYGASEGLRTVVLERTAPGGQAGTSMRIENYFGFPTGITGGELAERGVLQAGKFGAQMSIPAPVVSLSFDQTYSVLALEGGETVVAKCLLIATGADYRKLAVEGCERFEGRGVYYAATPNEAQLCRGADVVVVGGGNSAGQAAVYLAGQSRTVFLVVRDRDLRKNMSSYLAQRIELTENIEILLGSVVCRMSGDKNLAEVEILDSETGQKRTLTVAALFSFIGAVPRTEWLPEEIETDARGFICTGRSQTGADSSGRRREAFLLETRRPGVFAAGDVRAGSVKRVTSAVGEGAMAVQFAHEYLKEM